MAENSVLTTVLHQVYDLATEWQALGGLLGLDVATLRTIAMQNTANPPSTCLIAVLEWWINQTPNPGPYWEQLADAVGRLELPDAKKKSASIQLFCQGTGLTTIEPQPLEWFTNAILKSISNDFPTDKPDLLLQLKFLSQSLLNEGGDIDDDNEEKAEAVLKILTKLQEKFPADLNAIIYDILRFIELEHIIPADFKPPSDPTIIPVNMQSREYLYAKCTMKIARNLKQDEVVQMTAHPAISRNFNLSNYTLNSGTQLIYAMDKFGIVSSKHILRLHEILLNIGKTDMMEELLDYLKQTGQSMIINHIVEFPKQTEEIKIAPVMPIQKIDEMREQKKQKSVSPQLQCLLETEGQQIAELMDLLLKKKEDEAKSDPEMETKILLQEQKDKYKRKIKELKLQIQNRSQLIDHHCPPFYTISSTTNNRGYAVIINNFNFTSQAGRNELKLPNKSSSELDEFNIIELFGKCLGYQPVVYCNVNHSDISNGIRRYTNAVKDNQDSFVCFILSWGHGSYFYSSDGILTSVHEDVLPHLDTPSLQGKPKIIFVCTVCPPQVTKEAVTVTTTPTMADVLLVCATLSPQTLVEKQYGSPYIETLFQVLFSNCSSYDLVTILTMVNEEVIKNGHDVKQVIASSLTKQMVFLEKNPTITLKNNSSDSFDNQIDDLESAVLIK